MATITYSDGNHGIWLLEDLFGYKTISQSDTEIVLEYDPDTFGAYDPIIHPWQYTLSLVDAETEFNYDPGTGLQSTYFVGGTLSAVTAFDETGTQIAQMSDLSVALDLLGMYQTMGFGDAAQKLVYSGDHTITGSSNSGPSSNGMDGDYIRTGAGDDYVYAGRGDDLIVDQGGTDTYLGGKGLDIVSYDRWFMEPHLPTRGVSADLEAGTAIGPDGNTDSLTSIEGIAGSFLRDMLKGDDRDNVFFGMQGNDGMNGRGGFDMADYSADAQQGGRFGIKADLKAGTIRDGFRNIDKVKSIEAVRGTGFDDILRDDSQDNYLEGGAGWDVLRAGQGSDTLSGGTEDDMFVFVGDDYGHDVITDWDEFDFILIKNAENMEALTITQNGSSAEIEWNGNVIELLNTDASGLSEFGDFVFN